MRTGHTRTQGPVSDFDIRLFRLFRTVVACGGFAAAESRLGISRSAISQQMRDLESRLGLRLCQRGRAGFALTDEGQAVHRAAEQVLAVLEDFRAEVDSLHQHLRGELNIGITDNLVTAPQMRITDALAHLKTRGPAIRIHIRMRSPTDIAQDVLDGRLHIGVVPHSALPSGLDAQALYDERSHLYCAAGHPLFALPDAEISDALLARQDAVVPAFHLPAQAQAMVQALHGAASASDREGMAFLILTGQYIGYLPAHYARTWVDQGGMRAILPDGRHYDAPLVAITRKGRRPHLVLETFLEELFAAQPE